MKCTTCTAETANSYGLCDSCRAERTRAERVAQGLSPMITDDPTEAAWLARLLLPRDRIAS